MHNTDINKTIAIAARSCADEAIKEGFKFVKSSESKRQQVAHMPLAGDWDYLRHEVKQDSKEAKELFAREYREYLIDHAETEGDEEEY